MKKSTIGMLIFVALVVGGAVYVWRGPPKLRLVLAGDITAAFAGDLHDFVLKNSGRLPSDWQEFEKWEMQTTGKKRWPAAEIGERMRIFAEPYRIVDGTPYFIEVTDPDIKGMEAYINRMIAMAQLELHQMKETANHGVERAGVPLRGPPPVYP